MLHKPDLMAENMSVTRNPREYCGMHIASRDLHRPLFLHHEFALGTACSALPDGGGMHLQPGQNSGDVCTTTLRGPCIGTRLVTAIAIHVLPLLGTT
jgi:hypothetical protein